MNKVVPTVLVMSALLVMTGCSSSGAKHSSYSGVKATHASYSGNGNMGVNYANASYSDASCATCGQGYHAVSHNHGHNNNSGQLVTHTHAGTSGHSHNGMSVSHSYANTASHAGRNTYVGAGAARSSGGSTLAKVAGALLIGGLVYSATNDDDDSSSGSGSGTDKK